MNDSCEHCVGQRYDRAQVLRALRRGLRHIRKVRPSPMKGLTPLSKSVLINVIKNTIRGVRSLPLPHLKFYDPERGEQHPKHVIH